MSEHDVIRQRLKLMLRAERAFGATGVVDTPGERITPTAARSDRTPADVVPVNEPVVAAPATGVLFESGEANMAKGVELGPNRPGFDAPPWPRDKKVALLRAMDDDEVKGCPRCDLCKSRTHTVFGEGDADARLMFIGEGPGENEDLQGRPFVGRSGELLEKMIRGMGLLREQVYIANIVKCRPPNNRVPTADEVATCTPYLERQIEIIRPRAIVTLGLPSAQYMLQTKTPMGKLRGNWHAWRGIKLMPTYHPAYLLRNYTDATRAAVWSDLQQVMKALGIEAKRKS